MKKTVIFMLAMVSVSLVYAQKISGKEVPAAVKSALQKKYPNAKDLKWEKEKGNYEAEFEVTKTDYSLLMDASGNVLETEIEIKTEQLPAAAKSYVAKNYPGKKIEETAKITDSKGTVTYEAEIDDNDLIFNSNGNFLKEEKKQESNND